MRRVAVTGAAGFIGRRLVARLAAEGVAVLALDRVPPPAPPGGRAVAADLAAWAWPDDWRAGPPFALVHLAWDLAERGSWSAQAQQVRTLAVLLERLPAVCARVVGLGSAEEYGRRGGVLREEDAPVGPLSAYGWAKRAAGELALAWAQAGARQLAWLRPFVVYGPGQAGDMVVPYALRQARAGRAAEFTDGRQRRDFVHVDDVVAALLCALRRPDGAPLCCNLGTGAPVPVREVLEGIAARCGAAALFRYGARPRRPGEPELQAADLARARAKLGWAPRITMAEGLDDLCRAG